ncbi:MAG: hypothetical protein LBN94_02340 [Puniceicoccales bacterium]|nr:hypothetical protein [Puniceicoccales bacterium]
MNFRWALQSLRDDADDVHVKEVLRFLRDFLGKVPRYKYFAIDRDFFDMAKFIIRTHRLEANTKIRELIEAIDLEFQSVEDFIVSNPSYPFFFSVAPWHDVPFKQGIEENDIDKLKDAWKSCLELDPYHNVFFDEPMENSELWELWGKYREEAKKKDLWDDELDEIFCSLQEALFGEDKSRVYWF